ncbi:hypothetical protein KFK09_013350 [Dendrobium nobile]|uniref:Uncharacterized protein n=1 Tax=Dendrobium nobile TaxID=94219 RepID=A0A8T3B8U6_DENNO|nr:hypothetical protein KFK09_013350 [Dendrobium nobile]
MHGSAKLPQTQNYVFVSKFTMELESLSVTPKPPQLHYQGQNIIKPEANFSVIWQQIKRTAHAYEIPLAMLRHNRDHTRELVKI